MKAQHRHELKTNELAQWLANLPQWTMKNIKLIITLSVILIVAAAAGLIKWYYTQEERSQRLVEFTNAVSFLEPTKTRIITDLNRGIDTSFNLLQLAKELKTTAQNTKDKNLCALALIKQAEALRAELHYRPEIISKAELKSQLKDAKAAYNQALENTKDNNTLAAEATLGLGLCEEELGNFENAKKIYRQITNDPKYEATTAAATAAQRLKIMDELKQPVVFADAKKPKSPDSRPPAETELDHTPQVNNP